MSAPDLGGLALSNAFYMAFLAAVVVAWPLAAAAQPLAGQFGKIDSALLVAVLDAEVVIIAATALLWRELHMKALAWRTLLPGTANRAA